MNKIRTCERCFSKISKKSEECAYIWLNLCKIFYEADKRLILIKPFYYKQLRTLEMMKFILTTDTKNSVIMKVLGEEKIQDRHVFFCGGHCE